jgi:MFS family permease
MFLIVFSLQEGQSHNWAPWIWAVLVAGIGFMSAFIYWQSVSAHEPLIPLDIFRDRDFSLSNAAAMVIAFAVTGMILPLMFYAQAVCGLSPTRSALLIAPMAITSGVLARIAGRLVDTAHPRPVVGFGFSSLAIGLTWLSIVMTPSTAIWQLVLPFVVLGVAMAFIWAPLTATATRNLPQRFAGASSGVFNATRQVGAVLGSAAMASFMTSRIAGALGPMPGGAPGPPGGGGMALQMPPFLRVPFADAMSQSMLLPAFIALVGVVAAIFLVGPTASDSADDARPQAASGAVRSAATARRVRVRPSAADGFASGFDGYRDGFDDDDDYVEYTLPPRPASPSMPRTSRAKTELPDERRRPTPAESWRGQLDDMTTTTEIEPIRHDHNGFGVDPEAPFLDDIDTYGGSTSHDPRRNGYRQPPYSGRFLDE